MFYSEAILSKKGPLAKVWLAAHWERKLSKNQLLQTNLHNSVDAIMGADQAPMALRLSGQLLLGVARIYSRKTKYLLEDCNEALVKIKVAFRSDANNKGDNNLLALDGAAGGLADLPSDHSRAAFNAITVPDAMTEFDLLLPAQTFDINAWGLNPKLSNLSNAQDITLDENNDDGQDLFGMEDSNGQERHQRRLDVEVGRNHMNRLGGHGYSAMDFDLAGPEDALDLDIFGDDLGGADGMNDIDFLKRPYHRDDLDIEVGRDAGVQRRSASVDPFSMLAGDKQPLRLGEGSDDGRAPSVTGSVERDAAFDFQAVQDGARSPVHFDLPDMAEDVTVAQQEQDRQQVPATPKKRKLVIDEATEISQELLIGMNGNGTADGLLTTHDMLPRSRKLLRLQQIEQDVAHGGLAGYLLDCTAGPRVLGGALVPELASMFSRSLHIDQEVPLQAPAAVQEDEAGRNEWRDDNVESWVDQVQGEEDIDFGMHQATPPPADMFEGFQMESPVRDGQVQDEVVEEGLEQGKRPKTSLFQESVEDVDSNGPHTSTKELHGTVFSHSAIQTMRLVQQGLESMSVEASDSQRSTRNSSMVTASSVSDKDTPRVKFSELMQCAPGSSTPQKRNKADAAKLFFELLVLSTKDVVAVEQKESFGEITVGGSPWLKTLVEADSKTLDMVDVQA